MSLKINNDTANGSVTLQASNTATGDVVATLPPFSTELAPRMQLMTAKTASGTSVDFTGIPSWAKRITVMFSRVSTNGTSNIQVQLGSGSFSTTGYTAACNSNNSNGLTATSTTGLIVSSATGATRTHQGNVVICMISSTTWVSSSVLADISNPALLMGGGVSPALSGTLDRIRITTVNGTDTFDDGTINILVEG